MCAAFSSGVRDACQAFMRLAARRSCSLRSGRRASAVIVFRRASRWASETFGIVISSVSPTHEVADLHVARGREEPVLERRLDLPPARRPDAIDGLAAGRARSAATLFGRISPSAHIDMSSAGWSR